MAEPQRLQLSRRAGWRLPDGARSVTRPGRFGNPFTLTGVWRSFPSLTEQQATVMAVRDFAALVTAGTIRRSEPAPGGRGPRVIATYTYPPVNEIRAELAGLSLACWCPLPADGDTDWCHAAVLLAIANGREWTP